MAGSPDYILDIPGLSPAADDVNERRADPADDRSLVGRPWLAVYWRCCHTYSRIYRNRRRTAYEGRCPSCLRHVRAQIGENGTDCRLFFAE